MKRIYFYLIISFIFIISLLTDNVFAYKNTYKNIQVFQSNTPQLETSITIDPNNSNRILIGAKINGRWNQGYYYSTDGGKNWRGK